MLKYTGHPLVDVGAASIVAFDSSAERDPAALTAERLEKVIEYIDSHYNVDPFKGYIQSTVFFNSRYVNAGPEKRQEYIDQILRAYKSPPPSLGSQCSFCADEAHMLAFRQHIPLLGGEQAFNFFSEGQKGLPICYRCLLSIQAFPLGSVKCNGRALIVHSANPNLTYEFARRFSRRNRELAGLDEDVKFPKTMLIGLLLEIEPERRKAKSDIDAITAYHLTNYGTNADIDIYHLPLSSIDFIYTAQTGMYNESWHDIVNAAWSEEGEKKANAKPRARKPDKDKIAKPPMKRVLRRNSFYEDLFALPDNATRFLRTYFLQISRLRPASANKSQPNADITKGGTKSKARQKKANVAPQPDQAPQAMLKPVSWNLTSLFLRKVMNMDKTRIEAIRQLADRLVNYVQEQDARLFSTLYRARRYSELSLELLKANKQSVQKGKTPLFSFNQFVDIFEESEDTPRADWSLARDLVLVRMIEQLYAAGWWAQHQDQLEVAERDAEALD